MRGMLWALFSVIFIAMFAGAAAAQKVDTERQKEILELLAVINADQLVQQIANATAQSTMRSLNARKGKKLNEKQLQVLGKANADVFRENATGFVASIAQIYEQHFTAQEVRDIIRFYKTDTGKKSLAVLPRITAQSMAVGQAWVERLKPELIGGSRRKCKSCKVPPSLDLCGIAEYRSL